MIIGMIGAPERQRVLKPDFCYLYVFCIFEELFLTVVRFSAFRVISIIPVKNKIVPRVHPELRLPVDRGLGAWGFQLVSVIDVG